MEGSSLFYFSTSFTYLFFAHSMIFSFEVVGK